MRSLIFTTFILSLMACKASESDTEGMSATSTGGTSTTSVTTTGPTTGADTGGTDTGGTDTATSQPVTTTVNTDTTAEPGTTTGTTTGEPGTTTGEPGTTTGEPGTTTTGDTVGTTGGPVDCANLSPANCANEPACKAIGGAKINLAKMCTNKPMFIECVAAMACGQALTNGCDPADAPPEPFLFPDTCLPTDWVVCEAPMDIPPCK